jgi:glutamine synthetase
LHDRRADHREPYNRDPRGWRKSRSYLQSTGIADTAFFGPEAEFFIFDDVRFSNAGNSSSYSVDSSEGHWNSAREEFPNLGYKIRAKEGYFPVAPADTLQDIRNEMCLELEKAGIPIERQHHEVATAGQAEIDIRFAPLKTMGDYMQYYKYIVRNVARKHNKTVTFMPKPLFGDNGSGMHTHISLWKDEKPLFAGNGYAGLSDMALFFIGGILKHAPALTAITNPTTNSYKRLIPGFRRRSISLIRRGIGRPRSGFRPIRRIRNRSESNSAPRTRPRTHMSLLLLSSSRVWMESRTGSIRAIRSTRISTNFRRKNWRMCRACRIR